MSKPNQKKANRVSIVFEETGLDEQRETKFNVYMEGFERNIAGLPMEELSAAEFYASRMFLIVGDHLQKCGALDSTIQKGAFN